ncbi:MAG: type II toxin-antitoxin system RelE/ParE family toxin [Bacteroidota bacterium]
MAYKIILEDRAIEEIDHAFDWYESQRSGLGTDFMAELYDYLDLIAESPRLFPIDFKQYRKAVLKRFYNYIIIYSIEELDKIYVLSVFDTRQDPNKKYKS